ncbi:uncharacterized protein LOC106659448 [Trichogramma pretiosum]|uniref:uncharacterized protein LOC106659448 n=1 Tax=Trichogramma pretiosum TaxID=7493 RepID=UPI0006C9D8D5|nr:uncharacterized protein LOC106659448 [Trichogramma pretiosum]
MSVAKSSKPDSVESAVVDSHKNKLRLITESKNDTIGIKVYELFDNVKVSDVADKFELILQRVTELQQYDLVEPIKLVSEKLRRLDATTDELVDSYKKYKMLDDADSDSSDCTCLTAISCSSSETCICGESCHCDSDSCSSIDNCDLDGSFYSLGKKNKKCTKPDTKCPLASIALALQQKKLQKPFNSINEGIIRKLSKTFQLDHNLIPWGKGLVEPINEDKVFSKDLGTNCDLSGSSTVRKIDCLPIDILNTLMINFYYCAHF